MTSIRDAIKSKLKALGDRSDSKDELDEKKETVVAEMKSLVRAKSWCCFFFLVFLSNTKTNCHSQYLSDGL